MADIDIHDRALSASSPFRRESKGRPSPRTVSLLLFSFAFEPGAFRATSPGDIVWNLTGREPEAPR